MPRDKNRLKILGSLVVLVVVFVVAGIAQFGAKWHRSPQAIAPSPPSSQPRAVFGEGPPAPVQPPVPDNPETEPTMRARVSDGEKELAEIQGFLDRWRTSTIDGNVNAQTILYAPRMDHYFRKRNVSRDTVRREKARMKELYPTINRYDISDVRVESAAKNQAVVTFRKDWDMRGDRRFAGAERQRLKLRRMAGDWKIVSEEETKVYWMNRS